MKCPKCRFEQSPSDSCISCGIVFSSYNRIIKENIKSKKVVYHSSFNSSIKETSFGGWILMGLFVLFSSWLLWATTGPDPFFSDKTRYILFTILFSSMGGYLIFRTSSCVIKVLNSQTWPQVKGEIYSSTKYGGFDEEAQVRLCVRYEYTVGSKCYLNDTLCVGYEWYAPLFGRMKLRDRQRKYAEGQMVDVFYDPKNPQNSCLERTTEGSMFFYILGGGLIMIGISIWQSI